MTKIHQRYTVSTTLYEKTKQKERKNPRCQEYNEDYGVYVFLPIYVVCVLKERKKNEKKKKKKK